MSFSFANPYGLAALGAVVAVGLFCLLRPRAREVRFPSLMLWEKVLEEMPASSRRPTRRPPWRWVCWLLAASAACFALAGPHVLRLEGRAVWRFVVDTTPPMWAVGKEGRNGWARLRAELQDLSGRFGDGDSVEIQSDRILRWSGSEARQALAAWRPGEPGPLTPLWEERFSLIIARALMTEGAPTAVLCTALPDNVPRSCPVFPLGEQVENAGIIHLNVRPLEKRADVFVALRNFSPRARQVEVELRDSTGLARKQSLRLESHSEGWTLFRTERGDVPWLQARILPGDGFPLDDVAWLGRLPFRQRRVLWMGAEEPQLRRAISVCPDTEILDVPGDAAPPDGDVLVCVGTAPPEGWSKGALVVAVSAEKAGKEPSPKSKAATSEPQNPVMRDVDLSSLWAKRTPMPSQEAGWKTLVELAGQPLIQARETPARAVRINSSLEPASTNFVFLPAFVIMVSNALDWLAGEQRGGLTAFTAGKALPGGVSRDLHRIQTPEGLAGSSSREGESPWPGLYRMQDRGLEGFVAVNLSPEAWTPSGDQVGPRPSPSEIQPKRGVGKTDLSGTLAMLALALVAASWLMPRKNWS